MFQQSILHWFIARLPLFFTLRIGNEVLPRTLRYKENLVDLLTPVSHKLFQRATQLVHVEVRRLILLTFAQNIWTDVIDVGKAMWM